MARYRIDAARSRVTIDATSSLHPIHSEADGLDGWLEMDVGDDGLDLQNPMRGHVEFPVEKLTTGKSMEDRELRRRIDARRFPTISGDIESVTADTPGRYLVAGSITFRGVTKRYEDAITIEAPDPSTAELAGKAVFDIRDFGMEPPRILMLKVHPEVTVSIDVVATQEGKG